MLTKQTVDTWLNQVDYGSLNSGHYVPGTFALQFLNFIKLVNGTEGEENKTPVVHLRMLDEIEGKKQRIANLCARGIAKTTLMFEYLAPFIAIFEEIPGFGEVDSIIYVSDSMENGVKSARKNLEFRYNNSAFLQHYLPKAHFTDNYIEFTNLNGRKLGIKMFGAKTGLRGTKIFGKRPKLAILDDLVSDDDARSKTAMNSIKDTIYKGVDYALHPTMRKIIFNGTPFNKSDILYEAVESGAWHVNVWPICDTFPCSRKDFRGAWEDRFTYDYVKGQYDAAKAAGKLAAFNQELMLRITSDEEKLVQEHEIRSYDRETLLKNRHKFNFYITSDFAVSDKQSADYTVLSVWAYSANGDWFWVDGIRKRQGMDKTMDDLFRLVQKWNPQSVGVEVAGQQGGFIPLFQREMMNKNIWFNFTQGKTGSLGIRPEANKLVRFNMVVPWFKTGKIFFPKDMWDSDIVAAFINEISLATMTGIKARNDDCIDTISMLAYMNPWKPSEDVNIQQNDPEESDVWSLGSETGHEEENPMGSYIV